MLTKITQLAMAIGALMAFAIPAVASADAWTTNGSPVGTSTEAGVTVDGAGSISATTTLPNGTKIEFGPCVVHHHGVVWNEVQEEELIGHGEITSFSITTGGVGCEVWILNGPVGTTGTTLCNITAAEADVTPPWTVRTTGTSLAFENANISYHFNIGCPLGTSSGFVGTATGVFSGGNISVSGSADDLTSTSTGSPVDLDGSMSITSANGGTLTLD